MKNEKIFFVVIAVLVFIFFSPVFRIRQAIVQSSDLSCVGQNEISSNVLDMQLNFLLINQQQIEKYFVNRYVCIKSVIVKRLFWGKIELQISPRNRLANIAYYPPKILDLNLNESSASSTSALINWNFPEISSTDWFGTDDDGVVFARGLDNNFPIIFVPWEKISLGQRLDHKTYKNLLAIFSGLKSNGEIKDFFNQKLISKVVDNYLLIDTNPPLAISLDQDTERALASLQLILHKAKIDSRLMRVVDLRFNNPVIIYDRINHK